jgi:hypothetical protein
MKIKEFQKAIAKELNALDELVQGGCKAFAEDSREVYKESDQRIQGGKVAIVVVTPDLNRNGCAAGSIPAETQLLVQCSEKPALARSQQGVMTALDAAEIVMHALDGSQFCWVSTRQTIDRQAGVLTATVTFSTTIHLSLPSL